MSDFQLQQESAEELYRKNMVAEVKSRLKHRVAGAWCGSLRPMSGPSASSKIRAALWLAHTPIKTGDTSHRGAMARYRSRFRRGATHSTRFRYRETPCGGVGGGGNQIFPLSATICCSRHRPMASLLRTAKWVGKLRTQARLPLHPPASELS